MPNREDIYMKRKKIEDMELDDLSRAIDLKIMQVRDLKTIHELYITSRKQDMYLKILLCFSMTLELLIAFYFLKKLSHIGVFLNLFLFVYFICIFTKQLKEEAKSKGLVRDLEQEISDIKASISRMMCLRESLNRDFNKIEDGYNG